MFQRPRISLGLVAALSLGLLSACGKQAAGPGAAEPAAEAQWQPAKIKQTEKFGSVSSIVLDGSTALPARFAAYQREEVTEWSGDEYRRQPASAFEAFGQRWLRRAASVDKPDWGRITGIAHPESSQETNEFKKQEWAERTRQALPPETAALQMVMGWSGQVFTLRGPDVQTGEYYLHINADASRSGVGYSDGKHHFALHYWPSFSLTRCKECAKMDFTIKVPLERAREIEALREKGKDMVRLYGHVTGFFSPETAVIRSDGAEAKLALAVEAIELGSRQNGSFHSYFVLGPDQLAQWQP